LIIELKCHVDSTSDLASPYTFAFDNKEVIITPSKNDEGHTVVSEIAIKKRLPESVEFRTMSEPPAANGTPGVISVEGTEDIEKELVQDLLFLESLLSLCMVKKITWESPELVFIPETDQEKNSLGVYSWKRSQKYPKLYRQMKKEWLDERVGRFRDLTIPLAFFREGTRSYEQFNYIASFQNFYFIIEGFYAEGESKNEEDRFLGSKEFMGYVNSAFPQIMQIREKLDPFLEFYKLDATAKSFVKLLVKVRHRVHHYFHEDKAQEYFGNPLVQEYYQPLSLALMLLCVHLLFGKVESVR
jgi:hypothetical protein